MVKTFRPITYKSKNFRSFNVNKEIKKMIKEGNKIEKEMIDKQNKIRLLI